MTCAGTRAITYDARGNTLSETRPASKTVAATYDGYGRLLTYNRTGDSPQTNVYNGLDDRVSVTTKPATKSIVTLYLYDGDGRLLGEYSPAPAKAGGASARAGVPARDFPVLQPASLIGSPRSANRRMGDPAMIGNAT